MSNELVVKAAEAVEDLRQALELWCTRDDQAGSPLGVRGAADDAAQAAGAAITELAAVRNQVETEAAAYDQANADRMTALLGKVRPPAPATGRRTDVGPMPVAESPDRADYQCGDCGRVFVIDPTDPMTAHGAYLDHMEDHERDDLVDDLRDKTSEVAAAFPVVGELVMSSGLPAPEHFHPVRSWPVEGCARCEIETNTSQHLFDLENNRG